MTTSDRESETMPEPKRVVSDVTLDNWFGFHTPTSPDVAQAHADIRGCCRALASILQRLVPECPEKEVVFGQLRLVMFQANAALACNQEGYVRSEAPEDSTKLIDDLLDLIRSADWKSQSEQWQERAMALGGRVTDRKFWLGQTTNMVATK